MRRNWKAVSNIVLYPFIETNKPFLSGSDPSNYDILKGELSSGVLRWGDQVVFPQASITK